MNFLKNLLDYKLNTLVVILIWIILTILMYHKIATVYSPDSYAYHLLGLNLISGEGYVSPALRDFYLPIGDNILQPSRSFPPLYPFLIGLYEKVFAYGIVDGVMINIYILLGILIIYKNLIESLFKYPLTNFIFLLLPLYMLIDRSFIDEIVSGRSIPLFTILLISIITIEIKYNRSQLTSIIIGILLALLYLTRFDVLLFITIFFIYYFFSSKRKIFFFSLFISFSIILSPWIIRNLFTFNSLLVTDNLLTVLSTYPSVVPICFFGPSIPMIINDPFLWIFQRIHYLFINILRLKLAIFVFALAVYLFYKKHSSLIKLNKSSLVLLIFKKMKKEEKTFFLLSFAYTISHLFSVSLTPYHDKRYFFLSSFFILLNAIIIIQKTLPIQTIKNTSKKINLKLNVISIILFTSFSVIIFLSIPKKNDVNQSTYTEIYNAFQFSILPSDRIAFENAEHLAYYTGWHTIYLPLNILTIDKNFINWKNKFKVHYAIVLNTSTLKSNPRIIIKETKKYLLLDLSNL